MLGPKSKFPTVIQHSIDLVSKAYLPSLPRHRIDPIKYTELEQQVDESPLEIKQSCLVPIHTHIYEVKLWCEIVTENVDQVKDAFIYDRFIPENLKNVVMREYDSL